MLGAKTLFTYKNSCSLGVYFSCFRKKSASAKKDWSLDTRNLDCLRRGADPTALKLTITNKIKALAAVYSCPVFVILHLTSKVTCVYNLRDGGNENLNRPKL